MIDVVAMIDAALDEPRGEHVVVTAMRQLLEIAPTGKRRLSVDDYGLALAFAAALRADCTRRRVGAVILDPEGRIVSMGRNGLPPGRPGCATAGACPRGQKTYAEVPTSAGAATASYDTPGLVCDSVHGEVNAVIEAGRSRAKGSTLYVTCEPCHLCRTVMAGAGLARVVWPEGEWTP